MKKYKMEFKLEVVQSFLAGEGGAELLARLGDVGTRGEDPHLGKSNYRLHSIDVLRPKRSTYSAQFRLQVLAHQDREQLSSRQVAAVYEIPQDFSRRSNSAWAKNALASFRISLARRSSLTSRSSSFIRCASPVVTPPRTPLSISSRLIHSFSVCGTQSIFGAIDSIAAHNDGYSPRCSDAHSLEVGELQASSSGDLDPSHSERSSFHHASASGLPCWSWPHTRHL